MFVGPTGAHAGLIVMLGRHRIVLTAARGYDKNCGWVTPRYTPAHEALRFLDVGQVCMFSELVFHEASSPTSNEAIAPQQHACSALTEQRRPHDTDRWRDRDRRHCAVERKYEDESDSQHDQIELPYQER